MVWLLYQAAEVVCLTKVLITVLLQNCFAADIVSPINQHFGFMTRDHDEIKHRFLTELHILDVPLGTLEAILIFEKSWPKSQSPRIVSGASRKTMGRPATPGYRCATLSRRSPTGPLFNAKQKCFMQTYDT